MAYQYRIKMEWLDLETGERKVMYWNRDKQQWQDKEGGRMYPTHRGASIVLDKLFSRYCASPREQSVFTLYTSES